MIPFRGDPVNGCGGEKQTQKERKLLPCSRSFRLRIRMKKTITLRFTLGILPQVCYEDKPELLKFYYIL